MYILKTINNALRLNKENHDRDGVECRFLSRVEGNISRVEGRVNKI